MEKKTLENKEASCARQSNDTSSDLIARSPLYTSCVVMACAHLLDPQLQDWMWFSSDEKSYTVTVIVIYLKSDRVRVSPLKWFCFVFDMILIRAAVSYVKKNGGISDAIDDADSI